MPQTREKKKQFRFSLQIWLIFMASVLQPWLLLCLSFLFLASIIPLSVSQSDSPQNIETFYPYGPPPVNQPQEAAPPPPKSSSNNAVPKAIGITAASTLAVAGLLFFLIVFARRRLKGRNNGETGPNNGGGAVVNYNEFTRFDGNIKGLIVDENGLDVLYWRKLQGSRKNSFKKEVLNSNHKNEEEKEKQRFDDKGEALRRKSKSVQEIPLLRGKSSTSHLPIPTEIEDQNPISLHKFSFPSVDLEDLKKQESSIEIQSVKPDSTPPVEPQPTNLMAIPKKESPAPPPPPPPPPQTTAKKNPTPPPPPPPSPPQTTAKKNPAQPPPPPPKTGGQAPSSKPPPGPIGKLSGSKREETENNRVKLKPLHWDKVNANADHSMVWDKIDKGSFRFDGDLMEALFGSVATNRKSPKTNPNSSSNPSVANSGPPSQIFILNSRKSQNTAIVLRSLNISRREILDAIVEGEGLNTETLEKLTRIAPTKEEESEILAFDGDPTRLADAESFLYHLLKAVGTAFPRLNAMLFRSNFKSEIHHFKESLQTLEFACKELRTRGLFLKLLEAVLKAGNRMNAGTARGNAQAFNLTALRKLSDVKSTDGKTTLLHFVVEEVIRAEGKRCLLNLNRSLSRSSSSSNRNGNGNRLHSDTSTSKEEKEKEKEYIMFGLPVVGGLSAEFSNVKKAAIVDYEVFCKTCSVLTARLAEIQQIVAKCAINGGGGGGFVREMRIFLESAEEELKVVREEQTRTMELVKRTTEYYQSGASKDKEARPLQLFVIVKDFLGMVDKVCIDIAVITQKRPASPKSVRSVLPKSPDLRSPVKFPNLPEHFMSSSSTSSGSSLDDS